MELGQKIISMFPLVHVHPNTAMRDVFFFFNFIDLKTAMRNLFYQ